ncbi:MotA/TolQ/ExbB proton channel family protein [Aquimarina sp. 2201CG5-10]|uniref:MotA/TolQ/ExbB proton channel family protein n=1 Tax=Aquimarina callyspongiae TaxID=3098150 RepID=UPI002AB5BD7C|nr:MotA/TolQ/ExbB proton channel family protein [Aquimarina sp. 2201CG5-10]MDY8138218.1 MotA/TolQ/ExbB proton channel family protein [Aquimarina sp. 2201CG5-10]
MISLIVKLTHNPLLFIQLFDRMQEGGMFFMFPIFIILLLVIFLIIKSVLGILKGHSGLEKNIRLLNSIGLLTVVWGMLGQLIGVIGMFDQVDMIGEISTHIFAGGLKVSALPPVFGFVVFIISRVASIIFTWLDKDSE